jgi:hypothetical protein
LKTRRVFDSERRIQVRPLDATDGDWIRRLLVEHWRSAKIVSRGKVHYADRLPGFIALRSGKRVGFATYRIESDECEIVTLNSIVEGIGVGSALVNAVRSKALSSIPISRLCVRMKKLLS